MRLQCSAPSRSAHHERSPLRLALGILLLFAPALRAQEHKPAPQQTRPPQQARPPPPLSPEDAELVRDLALLERLELLKNLELFEPEPPAPQKP